MDNEPHSPEEIENAEVEKGSAVGPFFLTIFVFAVIGCLIYLPFYAEKEPLMGILNSDQWWVPNVGEYHPLILHLPVGIIGLTVFMEVCSWLSFGRYRPMTGVGLFLAFISGAFACVTGLFDMNVGNLRANDWGDDMFKHMWMGITFVGVLGLAFLAKIWGRRSGSRGPVYGILLMGSAGVMAYGAHFGGLETHGSDPIENTLIGFGLIEGEKKKVVESKTPKDRLAFAEVVLPILDNKCLYCHSEADKNNKGELWMDTYENLLVGGELQEDEPEKYTTLVPGDSKKSYMIEVMLLAMDDDMHMPPAKKKDKQMEDHEIKLLTWWVDNIPASETLEDKTLGEMGAPQEILDAAALLVSPEERKAMEAAAEAAKAKAEAEKVAKREALQNSLDTLKQDPAFKTSLGYASQDSTDLEFTAVSLREKMDDQTFLKLAPVAEALTSANLGSTSLTEAAILAELPKMRNLKNLALNQTKIGDSALDAVATLEGLERLNLYGTEVTDAGLMKLKGLVNMKKLYLWQSKVTEGGAEVEALKKALPDLEVIFGVN